MAARKRTAFQREADLARIADLYRKRWNQTEIAREIGVSQMVISRDLAVVRARWRAQANHDIEDLTQLELHDLDALEATYWAAYERSLIPREISTTESIELPPNVRLLREGETAQNRSQRRARLQKEQRDGNPAFLAGILACIDRRAKLLGLDAPTKVDITARLRDWAEEEGLDPAEVLREAQSVIQERAH